MHRGACTVLSIMVHQLIQLLRLHNCDLYLAAQSVLQKYFNLFCSFSRSQVEIETGSGNNNGGLDAHAAAVGLKLALHRFDWKTSKADQAKKAPVSISQSGSNSSSSSDDGGKTLSWKTGQVYSECQNLARELQDTPANLMTPTIFAERAKKEFEGVANITVNVHDEGGSGFQVHTA